MRDMLGEIEALLKSRFDPSKVREELLIGFNQLLADDNAFGKRFAAHVGNDQYDLTFRHVTISLFDQEEIPSSIYAYLEVGHAKGFPIGSYILYYDEMGNALCNEFSFFTP